MKAFEYKILRYTHDSFTGEFVNVGIIAFLATEKELVFKRINKYKRITDFFPVSDGHSLLRMLKNVERLYLMWNSRFKNELDFYKSENLSSITKKILTPDSSALQFGDTYTGVTKNLEKSVQDLFVNLVVKYETKTSRNSRSDEDAKKIVYNNVFKRFGINEHLKEHVIKTKSDMFEFKGWKNGVWNYYKPVSFDLIETDSIKDKVYKWAGITGELKTSDESFVLYLLTLNPKDRALIGFINKMLRTSNNSHKVEIVPEQEFSKFARKTHDEIVTYFNLVDDPIDT